MSLLIASVSPVVAPAITPPVFPDRATRRVLPVAAACAFALSLPILPNAITPVGLTNHPDRINAPRRLPVAEHPSFVEPPQVRFGFVRYSDSTFSSSCAFGAANASGNLLIAAVLWDNFAVNQISTITDTRGNVWKRATNAYAQDATVGAAGEIWYCENSAAGANTVTVTWTGATPGLIGIQVAEYRGQSLISALDVGANGVTASGTVATTSSFSTSANSTLVIGFSVPAGVATSAGTGFVSRGINAFGDMLEDDLTADPAGARTATANVSAGAAVMVAAAFSTWPVGAPFSPLVPLFGDASLPNRARGLSSALREGFGGYPSPIAASAFVANVGLTSFPDRIVRGRAPAVGDAEVTPIDRTSAICDPLFVDVTRRLRSITPGGSVDGFVPPVAAVPSSTTIFPDITRRLRPFAHGQAVEGQVPERTIANFVAVFPDVTRRARKPIAWTVGDERSATNPSAFSSLSVTVFPDALTRARRTDAASIAVPAVQIAPTIAAVVFSDKTARRAMAAGLIASNVAPERTSPLATVEFPRSVVRRRASVGIEIANGVVTPPLFFAAIAPTGAVRARATDLGSVVLPVVFAAPSPPPLELDSVHAFVARPRPVELSRGGATEFVFYAFGGAVISRLAGSLGGVSPSGEVATAGYLSVTIGGAAISGAADGVDLSGELGSVSPRGEVKATNDGGST